MPLLKALDRHAYRPAKRGNAPNTYATTDTAFAIGNFTNKDFALPSGVVEAGCNVVFGTRPKRTGMHWTVFGANAIIALRCSKLSGRYEEFRDRRSERVAA